MIFVLCKHLACPNNIYYNVYLCVNHKRRLSFFSSHLHHSREGQANRYGIRLSSLSERDRYPNRSFDDTDNYCSHNILPPPSKERKLSKVFCCGNLSVFFRVADRTFNLKIINC